MLLFYIASALAVLFRDSRTGFYLGNLKNRIALVPDPSEALDISIENTFPAGISLVLSLGTKALQVPKNEDTLAIGPIHREDQKQFFKALLTKEGDIILQHKDQCVGGLKEIEMLDCDDERVIAFVRWVDKEKKVYIEEKPKEPGFIKGTIGKLIHLF